MALIDKERGVLTLRIVFDGPALSGKTTSIQALAAALKGDVFSPGENWGRTLFFDWLDYVGGRFEGMAIRCQLVTVPGQDQLAQRREFLLQSADAVIFVLDSSPERLEASLTKLGSLRELLRDQTGPPVGIVVQANKRDRPGAVPLPELQRRLGESSEVAITETVASEGEGLRPTLVFAVRLGLDRVRQLRAEGQLIYGEPEIDSGEELLEELLAAEQGPPRAGSKTAPTSAAEAEIEEGEIEEGDREERLAGRPPSDAVPASEERWDGPLAETASRNRTTAPDRPPGTPRPPHERLSSQLIWPPVVGRVLLHEAVAESARLRRWSSGDWGAQLGASPEVGWHLHSAAEATFSDSTFGAEILLLWARQHSGLDDLLSERRCLTLAPDGAGGWRLWQLFARHPSLEDRLDRQLQGGSPSRAARCLLEIGELLLQARQRFGGQPASLPITLANLSDSDRDPRYIGIVPLPGSTPARLGETSEELLARALAPSCIHALQELALSAARLGDELDVRAAGNQQQEQVARCLAKALGDLA